MLQSFKRQENSSEPIYISQQLRSNQREFPEKMGSKRVFTHLNKIWSSTCNNSTLTPSQHLDVTAEKHMPSKTLGVKNHPEYLELNNSLSPRLHGKGEWNTKDMLRAEQEHLPWQSVPLGSRKRIAQNEPPGSVPPHSLSQGGKFVRTCNSKDTCLSDRSLSLSCDCSSICCGNGFIYDIIIAKIKQKFKINPICSLKK